MNKDSDMIVLRDQDERNRLRWQRDLAQGCAIFACVLAGAILWHNFGKPFPEVEQAQQAVRQHRELLDLNQNAMGEVHRAMLAERQVLEKLRAVPRGSD